MHNSNPTRMSTRRSCQDNSKEFKWKRKSEGGFGSAIRPEGCAAKRCAWSPSPSKDTCQAATELTKKEPLGTSPAS